MAKVRSYVLTSRAADGKLFKPELIGVGSVDPCKLEPLMADDPFILHARTKQIWRTFLQIAAGLCATSIGALGTVAAVVALPETVGVSGVIVLVSVPVAYTGFMATWRGAQKLVNPEKVKLGQSD